MTKQMRNKKGQYMKRTERYEQVVTACMVIEQKGQRPTVASICHYLSVSVSTHMRKLINELTEDNDNPYLHKIVATHWNAKTSYYYLANHQALATLCPEWYAEKTKAIGLLFPLPAAK